MPGRIIRIAILILLLTSHLHAAQLKFAEQFYRLYHLSLNRYAEESAENIWYLSMALRSPFANPLNALAKIENENEWEKYRMLFYMHIHLKIIDEYLAMAAKYDKFKAYFYNYPWKYVNLDSLKTAQAYYELALESWQQALDYADKARSDRFKWMQLEEVQYWEDEAFRIQEGELDYSEIIESHIKRLESVRTDFEAMDYNTY